eukprot:2135639-Rhodomonas_salina.4
MQNALTSPTTSAMHGAEIACAATDTSACGSLQRSSGTRSAWEWKACAGPPQLRGSCPSHRSRGSAQCVPCCQVSAEHTTQCVSTRECLLCSVSVHHIAYCALCQYRASRTKRIGRWHS